MLLFNFKSAMKYTQQRIKELLKILTTNTEFPKDMVKKWLVIFQEKIAFVIVGLPGTGKSSTGNIILGKKKFSIVKNPDKSPKKVYKMESTDDKNIIVFDTAGKINKATFKEIMENANVVAHQVAVLVTAKADSLGGIMKYFESITESKSILKNSYLIIWSKDKQSKSKERESETLKELMTNFPTGYMHIAWDLSEEQLAKQRQELIGMVKYDDEVATGSDEVPMDTDQIAAIKGFEEDCMEKIPSYIAIIGSPGSGKSSTGNVLLGEDAFETDLYNDKQVMKECRVVKRKDKQKEIYIVDTPGEMDPASVKKYLDSLGKKKSTKYALLMTMNVSTRMSPAEQARISQMKSAFGDSYIKDHLYVVFTHGDQFNILVRQGRVESFETFVRSHTGSLGDLLKLCSYRCVLVNNCEQSEVKEKESVAKIFNMILKAQSK